MPQKTALAQKIEVVIIEDDARKAKIYATGLKELDEAKQLISDIHTCQSDTDFFAKCSRPAPNKLYIADLIIRTTTLDGAAAGVKVLEHILARGSDVPLSVRSGETSATRNSPESCLEKYPHIEKYNKDANQLDAFLEKMFTKIELLFGLLNPTFEVSLSIDDCLGREGETILGVSSVHEIFDGYVERQGRDDNGKDKAGQKDINGALFIAQSLLAEGSAA